MKIAPDKYRSEVQVTPEDLQSYFKANAAQYTIPEKRNLTILIADQNKLQSTVNPTDDQLRVAYNQDQAQFRIPETVKVRHILLKTQGKPASEDPKIKAQAEDMLKQVKAGANFAALVNQVLRGYGLGGERRRTIRCSATGRWCRNSKMRHSA